VVAFDLPAASAAVAEFIQAARQEEWPDPVSGVPEGSMAMVLPDIEAHDIEVV
jgi:hypothetical protein